MIKSFNTLLKEIANLPEMEKNTISLVLAEHPNLDITKKDKFFEIISPLYNSYKSKPRKKIEIEGEEIDLLDKYRGDYRIKKIKISNIRGIPDSKKPYGIDLTEEDEPVSMVILGTNGVGKSSIYDAVEYTICRRVGEAELRSSEKYIDNDKRFIEYLKRFNIDFSESDCVLETVKQNISIKEEYFPEKIRKQLNPHTHFISDFDIYSNGQLNYGTDDNQSFHHLVAESIGLTELLNLNRNLLSFIQYRRDKEKRNNSALQKESKTLIESIGNWEKSQIEKKQTIEDLEKQKISPKEDEKIKQIAEILSRLKLKNYSIEFSPHQFTKSFEEFAQIFAQYNSTGIHQRGQNEYEFLKFGLELVDKYNNCPFCNSSNKAPTEIKDYISKRITEIKDIGEIKQNLFFKSNEINGSISNLLSQIDRIEIGINSEIDSIKEFEEFAELSQGELQFLSYSSKYTANDFFNGAKQLGGGLTENQDEKFSRLKHFEESNTQFIKEELNAFISKIEQFIKFRLDKINEVEKKLSEKSQQITLIEKISFLKKEIADIEVQINNAKTRIKSIEREIESNSILIESFQIIRDEVIAYQKILEEVKNKEVNTAFTPIKTITETILKEYFKEEYREATFSIDKKPIADEDTGEILSEIIVAKITRNNGNSNEESLSPNKYFNTFHYRMFSAMVGISIAIASRIKTGINLPLILDDIFYASDFMNRTTIERFIRHLFEIFKEYTPNQPLQLILLTHDELIFDCANNTIIENNLPKVAFAKLFPYYEAEEKEDYKELSFRIPIELPQTIFEALR